MINDRLIQYTVNVGGTGVLTTNNISLLKLYSITARLLPVPNTNPQHDVFKIRNPDTFGNVTVHRTLLTQFQVCKNIWLGKWTKTEPPTFDKNTENGRRDFLSDKVSELNYLAFKCFRIR